MLNDMQIRMVTFGMPVRDLAAATTWYQKVLQVGEPDLKPTADIAEFDLGSFWIQLEEAPERAGLQGITVNIEVPNLAEQHRRLESAGVRLTDIESVPGVVEYFEAVDADDNRLGFVKVLD